MVPDIDRQLAWSEVEDLEMRRKQEMEHVQVGCGGGELGRFATRAVSPELRIHADGLQQTAHAAKQHQQETTATLSTL